MNSELLKKIEGVFLGRKTVNLTLKADQKNDPRPIDRGFLKLFIDKKSVFCVIFSRIFVV